MDTVVSSIVAPSTWNYTLLPRRSTPPSEVKQRVGKENGVGLGSAAPTRQLNAPWAWWISNWRLVTSEVCWIIVSVMNGRDRAWQISAVTPLPEMWAECVWKAMCMCVCVWERDIQVCTHLRWLHTYFGCIFSLNVNVKGYWWALLCVYASAALTCGKQQEGNEDKGEGMQKNKGGWKQSERMWMKLKGEKK